MRKIELNYFYIIFLKIKIILFIFKNKNNFNIFKNKFFNKIIN